MGSGALIRIVQKRRNVTILLAPLAARGNDIRGATDSGLRGGRATVQRLPAAVDRRGREPKRYPSHADGDACGQEACRGAHTRNRGQNDNCQSTNGIRSLIN
jgi:hypothetical protein